VNTAEAVWQMAGKALDRHRYTGGPSSYSCDIRALEGGLMVTEVAALRNVVSPAPRAIWQAVFDLDAEAVPYQSPQWTDHG
jgi:hypothetical protein